MQCKLGNVWKIQDCCNKYRLQYYNIKFVQLKQLNSDVFRPFLVGSSLRYVHKYLQSRFYTNIEVHCLRMTHKKKQDLIMSEF